MSSCPNCGSTVEDKWILCPSCGQQLRGPPGQKIAFSPTKADPPRNPPEKKSDQFIPPTAAERKRKNQITAAFGVVLIVIIAIFSIPPEKYELRYTVVVQSSEDIFVSDAYKNPGSVIKIGGLSNMIRGCIQVFSCSHERTFSFEYDDPFEAEYTVYVGGSEYVEDITVCISIELDFLTLDASCFLYHDPNDDLNYGIVTTSHYINQMEIDKIQ